MNTKRIVLFVAILIIAISSVSMVSAGWFDFLDGGSSDSVENPIIVPNNTKKVVIDSANSLIIGRKNVTEYNGAHYFTEGDRSGVSYTSKNVDHFLDFRIDASFDVRRISDENVRSAFVNFTKETANYDFNSADDKDSLPKFFTNPNSENGGAYLKFYDKNNNSIFTQNIVFLDGTDDYGVDIKEMKYWEYTSGLTNKRMHEFTTVIYMHIDEDSRDGILDTIEKTDRAEFHILLTNGTNVDICMPLEIEKRYNDLNPVCP